MENLRGRKKRKREGEKEDVTREREREREERDCRRLGEKRVDGWEIEERRK